MSTSQPNSTSAENGTASGHNRAENASHHDEPHHAVFPKGKDFFAWIAIGVVGAVLLFISITAGELFSPGIRAGDIAEKDIVAAHDAVVVDVDATKKAVEDAREHVIPVFRIDRSHDQLSLDMVKKSLMVVKEIHDAGVSPAKEILALSLTPEEYLYALTCPESTFNAPIRSAPAPGVLSRSESLITTLPTGDKIMESLKAKLSNPIRAPSLSRTTVLGKTECLQPRRSQTKPPAQESAIGVLTRQRALCAEFLKTHKGVTNDQILVAISVKPDDLPQFTNSVLASTRRLCERFERFPVSDKSYWHGTISEFLPDHWSEEVRKHVATIICGTLEPNVVIDPGATKVQADAAIRAVQPVTKEIKQGEIVVHRGEVVTDERLQVLQLLSVKSVKSTTLLVVLGISLLTAIAFFAFFLLTYEPQHFFSTTSIALLYTIAIVTCVTAALLGNATEFVPIPAAALVLTIFFNRRVAAAMILPLVLLLSVDGMLSGAAALALGCAAIAAIVSYTKKRKALVFTALIVGIAQAGGYLVAFAIGKLIPMVLGAGAIPLVVAWLTSDFSSASPALQSIALQFAGGIALSIIAIGLLPFLENIFGLTTPYRLVELTDAEQPLLRQLEEKAPGTYQHSLAVANLAEAGAKAINADANLVRAGAIYHDIGKMVKPRFFIENQLGATNPHDSMSPEDSRERVLAHVTDGLELAKKYSLPKAVQDFIPMHQGTTLMAYFYHKACLRDGVENVDPNFYRYPGPKPHSKETAIVMLADVSEAVTHSMKDPTEEEVEEAIENVFENRRQDGQFTESGLTFDELQRVKLAFVRVWRTLHHDRLKYPATTTGRMPMAPVAVSGTADKLESNSNDRAPHAVPEGNTAGTDEAQSNEEGSIKEAVCAGSGAAGSGNEAGCDCAIAVFGTTNDPVDLTGGITRGDKNRAGHQKQQPPVKE